jgi:hypothetical protein
MSESMTYSPPLSEAVLSYTGPGASALLVLVDFMQGCGDYGATLDEALPAVMELTERSNTTVLRAWLTLIDLDLIRLVGSNEPRIGRHRDRHVWSSPDA